MKIARYATGRPAIVVFDHAYHGRTNLDDGDDGQVDAVQVPDSGPFAPEIYRMPMSYPFRDGLSRPDAAAQAITMIEKQIGADQVAAVIIEPIQGEGGFVVPAPGFLAALSAWCTADRSVFVADEIQTGFCRTGDWFASEDEGIVPDVVTTAKGIAGGLPLAGVTGRAEIMDAVHSGGIGGTYGGNPVACAAALASITTMRARDLAGAARRIEGVAMPRLRSVAEKTGLVGDVRGRGAMLAIEFTKPGTLEPDPALTARVAASCHQAGVIVLTCGTYNNVIRLLPPLVIGDELLEEGLGVLVNAIEIEALG